MRCSPYQVILKSETNTVELSEIKIKNNSKTKRKRKRNKIVRYKWRNASVGWPVVRFRFQINQKLISLLFVWVCRNLISFWELHCSLVCRHFMRIQKIEGDAEAKNFLDHRGRPAEFLLYEFGKFLWGNCWATTHINCVLCGESMSPLGPIKIYFFYVGLW